MKPRKLLTNPELAALILDVVRALETEARFNMGVIDMGDPAFDKLPCSRTRLYRVAKAYCDQWGYTYQPVTYKASRAYYHRPFDGVPDDLKARFTKPALVKVKL